MIRPRSFAPLVVALALAVPACVVGNGSPPSTGAPTATRTSMSVVPAAPTFDDPIDVVFDPSGMMWVGNYRSSTLVGFRPADLRGVSGSATVEPSVTLTGLHGPNQLLFDEKGALWVASYDDDSIRAYPPSALSSSGTAKASIVIRGSHIAEPTDLAFDGRGSLWVANQGTGDVVSFAAQQLEASGRPRPRTVLHPFPNEEEPPEALAFDGQGRLWVSDYNLDVVLRFGPGQLERSGTPSPSLRLRLPDLSGPIGLTFDTRDRLWVAEATGSALAVFPSGAHGQPSPEFTVTGDALQMPHTVVFGPDASVWVPCYDNTVLRYGAADLGGTQHPKPTLILS